MENIIDSIIYKIFNKSLDIEPVILPNDQHSFPSSQNNLIIDDYSLFLKAITHKSFDDVNNYEVLECLGDGFLKGVIVNAIMDEFPDANEGYITEIRFTLENTETFSKLLLNEFSELIDFIRYKDIRKNELNKLYEDIFEAFAGALLSFALSNNQNLISYIWIYYKNMFVNYIQFMKKNKLKFDTSFVKKLAIYCNHFKKDEPIYTTINKINTDDGIKVHVKLNVGDIEVIKYGTSIKDAEKNCAEEMLEILKNHKTKSFNINNICWYD